MVHHTLVCVKGRGNGGRDGIVILVLAWYWKYKEGYVPVLAFGGHILIR